jgi:membrane-bound metal-dependent hydrolase YbcI (DUF457 family)
MPSPVGHLLAGAAIGLAGTPPRLRTATLRGPRWQWVLVPALLAALPDADLLIDGFHRRGTHSIAAVALVLIVAIVVTRKVTRLRWALVVAAAYGSHLGLDLLGADPNPPSGIQLLWPFSDRWFISGIDWFPGTERRLGHPDLIATNLRALFYEVLTLGPALGATWLATRRRRSRVPTSVPDTPPPPSA